MRIIRIATAVLATAAILTGTAVVTAPAASAATACTVQANLPARVTIDRDQVVTKVTLSGCEGRLNSASAELYGPGGVEEYLGYYSSRTDYMHTYASLIAPGVYRTTNGRGYIDNYAGYASWRYTSTTIKFASRASLTVKRSGVTVTLSPSTTKYTAYYGFVGRSATGTIQQSNSPNGPWASIASVKTNSSGRATFNRRNAGARYYRVVFADTATTFGSTSAVRHI